MTVKDLFQRRSVGKNGFFSLKGKNLIQNYGDRKGRHLGQRETLPSGYNSDVMNVRQFTEEVKHRQTEREHTLSLSHGQCYTLREMRVLFGTITDEDMKGQINILEKTIQGPITIAIYRELNLLRRNGVSGQQLLKNLTKICHQHSMRESFNRRSLQSEDNPIPKIVCSERWV